jgi:hypothetical protein
MSVEMENSNQYRELDWAWSEELGTSSDSTLDGDFNYNRDVMYEGRVCELWTVARQSVSAPFLF